MTSYARLDRTGDRATDDGLRAVEHLRVVDAQRTPGSGGRAVLAVACPASGDVRVTHGLGRQPQAWWVTDVVGGDASLRRVSWDATVLVLHSSSACVVDLWVA